MTAGYSQFRYLPAGDRALVVEVGNEISPEVHQKVRGLVLSLEQSLLPGICELVPTYRSVMIFYDPDIVSFNEFVAHLKQLETHVHAAELPEPRIVELPVVYGGDFGPDIKDVAEHHHLSEAEVVALHSGRDYLVYMLGFTPGFCYLGGMNKKLDTPRLETPRSRIPAGSVGIAGLQTGIYPIDSPGGWRIIGRTPQRIFDPQREPPVLIRVGDYVHFTPIVLREYTWRCTL